MNWVFFGEILITAVIIVGIGYAVFVTLPEGYEVNDYVFPENETTRAVHVGFPVGAGVIAFLLYGIVIEYSKRGAES